MLALREYGNRISIPVVAISKFDGQWLKDCYLEKTGAPEKIRTTMGSFLRMVLANVETARKSLSNLI
jgi:hypothetical protein